MARGRLQRGEQGRAGARAPRPRAPASARPLRGKKGQRGVALMIAVISIAILTAVATEFAYSTRVDLQMAANQRDDIRAYYLARSGIGLSRLMLSFQKQLDNIQLPPELMALMGGGGLESLLGGAGGAAGAAGAAGGANAMPPSPGGLGIRLWELARIDCYMLQAMVPPVDDRRVGSFGDDDEGDEGDPDLAGLSRQRDFGGFEGCFDVQIEAEEPKINVNALSVSGGENARRFIQQLSEKQFEFLFEREDSHGVRVTPTELAIAIEDWVDQDKVQSSINLQNVGTGVFQKGFSDENYAYDRYDLEEYQAKNGYLDSLDELYQVHGVNDAFMAAFRDKFTAYTDINQKTNIATSDPLLLINAILATQRPTRPDPKLLNPIFLAQLLQQIQMMTQFSFLGLTPQAFVGILTAAGVDVDPGAVQRLDTKVNTFTIKATGEAGSIKKRITAVVRMDQGGLGRLVYWREE